MTSIVDYYNGSANFTNNISGAFYTAQSFTASKNYDLYSVKIRMSTLGSPGTITMQIKSSLTGSALRTATINGDSDLEDAYREFVMPTKLSLTADSVYYIVCFMSGGGSSNNFRWNFANTNAYAGGAKYTSNNYGSSWTIASNQDHAFETYEEISGPANLKSINGLVKASVKSVDGLVIGSIKNINGLT